MNWKPFVALAAAGLLADHCRRSSRPYHRPCGAYRIIQGYGGVKQRGKRDRFHTAVDFELPVGSNVFAADDGRVVTAFTWGIGEPDPTRGYGRMVDIQHSDGRITRYAHLREVLVSVGESVSRGQVIAHSGASGHVARRPRLHFEVRDPDGTTHDPAPLIRW